MLQQEKPDDYVVATGETHDVREFVDAAFSHVGLKWQDHVKVDDKFYRPAEVQTLTGDASKARRALGWKESVRFHRLVEMMVEADLKHVRDGAVGAGSARPA
jgi:GDPmannose 4,6-dehydratase